MSLYIEQIDDCSTSYCHHTIACCIVKVTRVVDTAPTFKFCQTGAISQNLVTLIILIIIQKLGHVENRNREVKDENLFKKRFGKTGFDGSCKSEISRKKRKKEKKFFPPERKNEKVSISFQLCRTEI